MPISLEQLRVLHAVVQAGSFSAAARQLGKVQSAISTTIANLEIDLGLSLFDRSGHTPQLTAAGKRILNEAQQVLGMCEHLEQLAGELASGVEPVLTLAIDDDSQLPWLAPLLEQFSAHFPDVELELLFPLMEDLCDMLASGRAHLGIGYQQSQYPEPVMRTVLTSVSFPVVVSSAHPLAHKKESTLADLQGARQLLVTNRRGGQERERFRFSPNVWWVEGDQAVLELTKRGLGWASVPSFLLQNSIEKGEVISLPIEMPTTVSELELELLTHRALPLGKAGRWFRDALVQYWQTRN